MCCGVTQGLWGGTGAVGQPQPHGSKGAVRLLLPTWWELRGPLHVPRATPGPWYGAGSLSSHSTAMALVASPWGWQGRHRPGQHYRPCGNHGNLAHLGLKPHSNHGNQVLLPLPHRAPSGPWRGGWRRVGVPWGMQAVGCHGGRRPSRRGSGGERGGAGCCLSAWLPAQSAARPRLTAPFVLAAQNKAPRQHGLQPGLARGLQGPRQGGMAGVGCAGRRGSPALGLSLGMGMGAP